MSFIGNGKDDPLKATTVRHATTSIRPDMAASAQRAPRLPRDSATATTIDMRITTGAKLKTNQLLIVMRVNSPPKVAMNFTINGSRAETIIAMVRRGGRKRFSIRPAITIAPHPADSAWKRLVSRHRRSRGMSGRISFTSPDENSMNRDVVATIRKCHRTKPCRRTR